MLRTENTSFGTEAIIAPAVVYEAGRSDIMQLNARLHSAAVSAGQTSGKPVYATVVLGNSIANSQQIIDETLSRITGLECDGWYFAFEFPVERIPSNTGAVYNCLHSILTLAGTGAPVLHAYAGPMGILSMGAGATASAMGPSQKQWRFCRERWKETETSGGGGNAPRRYFSKNLWGTLVVPDELVLLTPQLRQSVMSPSPFASNPLPPVWKRGDSDRHNVFTVCKGIEEVSNAATPLLRKDAAIEILDTAISLHRQIASGHISLKDETAGYQSNWKAALEALVRNHQDDYDFLEML